MDRRWIRNFIWSGAVEIKKNVIVSWHIVSKPFEEGGLGLQSVYAINRATMLKLGWDMLSSNFPWGNLLQGRVNKK